MNLSEPYILFENTLILIPLRRKLKLLGDSTTGAQGNPANAPGE